MSTSALQTCADRITTALEYLDHEPDLRRAIGLARTQLQHARVSLAAARGAAPSRRPGEQPLTFTAAESIPRSTWPPIETSERDARSFTEVQGRLRVAQCEELLENLP